MMGSMDFELAISSHQLWKTRLLLIIKGEAKEKLDPNHVCRDDQCDLGKWLHGEGACTAGSKPEFEGLKTLHADFHASAGRVLWRILAGDQLGAIQLLNGEFDEASRNVIRAIVSCRGACKSSR
jgi:methyl-accepting chemotaxis protein